MSYQHTAGRGKTRRAAVAQAQQRVIEEQKARDVERRRVEQIDEKIAKADRK